MDGLIPELRFNFAISIILKHEGGYSNNPKDPGGETNFGITLKYLQSLCLPILKRIGIKEHNSKAIKNLSKQQAIDIYKITFWDKYHYEAFNSIIVATKVFDMAVNMGSVTAHELLQCAINSILPHPIVIDGKIGPHTIASVNECNPNQLHNELCAQAKKHYLHLIVKNPKLETFKNGWLERALW